MESRYFAADEISCTVYVLMVTVEPDARLRLKVSPAGTVKLLMTTVVHFTAAATSSMEEIVPVQSEAAGAALTATVKKARARRGLK